MNKKFSNLRKELGLTQLQMAQYLELDQSYISKFENGEREIPLHVLRKIANLASVNLNYFFEENIDKINIVSFRAASLDVDDLKEIAKINQVALNLKWMIELVKKDEN